jgi:hypothetical protein
MERGTARNIYSAMPQANPKRPEMCLNNAVADARHRLYRVRCESVGPGKSFPF